MINLVPNSARFWSKLPWIIAALQLAWWSYGCLPICPVEGDEQGVIFGVQGMLTQDVALQNVRYTYEVQPGSYHLLAGLTRITGLPVETVFASATIIGALAFAFTCAWLLRAILNWPLAWALVALLWCQEITAASYYMNTSAIAGSVVILALILCYRMDPLSWLWSALLLALGGWIRADSLLVAPACLALCYWHYQSWKLAVTRTAIIAATSTALVIALYSLSGTHLGEGMHSYAGRGYALTGWRTLVETTFMLLSPLLTMFVVIGCGVLLWRRNYTLCLITLCGCIPTLGAYATSLTTPKYFYYAIPFILLPALYFIDLILAKIRRKSRRFIGLSFAASSLVLIAEGVVGVRTLAPEERIFTTQPTWATLLTKSTPIKNYAVVLGPGELILNADGFRLRTATWFAPWCWHREKANTHAQLTIVRTLIQRASAHPTEIFWSGWVPYQLVSKELFAAGFSPEEPLGKNPPLVYPDAWKNGERIVRLRYHGYTRSSYSGSEKTVAPDAAGIFFVGEESRSPIAELSSGRRWHLISEKPEGFINVYQRR